MAFALVGAVGAEAGGGVPLTPAWGTGATRTVGNLLVCWATNNTNVLPTLSGTWQAAVSRGVASGLVAIYYKVCDSAGEAAPSITGTTGFVFARLAEFSGGATTSPVDQTAANNGTTATTVATAAAADAQAGELAICAGYGNYSASVTNSVSNALNNGATATQTFSAGSAVGHYAFGYGTTTGNAGADADTVSVNTTSLTAVETVLASFKLLSPPVTVTADSTGQTLATAGGGNAEIPPSVTTLRLAIG